MSGRMLMLIGFLSIVLCAKAQNRSQNADLYGAVEDASELKPGENVDEKIRKNFFLRAEVSKTTCYVGEPIMAVFKAYSRLDANSQVTKRPSLSGFSVIEMVDAYNNQPDVEKYNGEYYYVHLIRKVQLFPLQAGDFTLESAEVESVIQMRSASPANTGSRLRNLFRRNRADPALQRQMIFKTPEVVVHVLPLPSQNQPEDFSGAVGNFGIRLVVDDTVAARHQALKVTLRLTGSGNFPLITDPSINWPDGIEVTPPIVTEDVNKYQFPLSGLKTFEYSLDNTDTGTYHIPSVRFSFFDPQTGAYKTVSTDTLTYVVRDTEKSNKTIPLFTNRESGSIPLHYYYFAVVVFVIIVVIIYMSVKKRNR